MRRYNEYLQKKNKTKFVGCIAIHPTSNIITELQRRILGLSRGVTVKKTV